MLVGRDRGQTDCGLARGNLDSHRSLSDFALFALGSFPFDSRSQSLPRRRFSSIRESHDRPLRRRVLQMTKMSDNINPKIQQTFIKFILEKRHSRRSSNRSLRLIIDSLFRTCSIHRIPPYPHPLSPFPIPRFYLPIRSLPCYSSRLYSSTLPNHSLNHPRLPSTSRLTLSIPRQSSASV